jgi:transcriptional regulator with XRE-family HTH domain
MIFYSFARLNRRARLFYMLLNHTEIRKRREKLGLSQSQAAERAGMLRPNWARIELGNQSNPKLSTLGKVAKALRCKVASLIETE